MKLEATRARCWRVDEDAVMHARSFRVDAFIEGTRISASFVPERTFKRSRRSPEVPQAADFELFEVVRPERFELPAY